MAVGQGRFSGSHELILHLCLCYVNRRSCGTFRQKKLETLDWGEGLDICKVPRMVSRGTLVFSRLVEMAHCCLSGLGGVVLESNSNHLQSLHFTPLSFILCSSKYRFP
jgi:hypothetical protein